MRNISLARSANITAHAAMRQAPPTLGLAGKFASAAAAAAVVIRAASATGVAGERENYENRNDHPNEALVVIEKSAKTVVIHGKPP